MSNATTPPESQIAQQRRLLEEHRDELELPALRLTRFGALRLRYVCREDFFLDRCRDKSVLHVGCSSAPYTEQRLKAGTHLHQHLLSVGEEVFGVDLSGEGLQVMQRELRCGNLYLGDAEALDQLVMARTTFDVILVGDILEHLNNPGRLLAGVTRFMHPSSELVLSTNNAFSLPNFLRLLFGGFREGTGHVVVSSPATLTNLVDRHGMRVTEIVTAYQRKPRGIARTVLFSAGAAFLRGFPALGGTLIVVAMRRRN
jgi:2-polyprenyl-3-methyl-5-hydroxy-6-metoxy-1,4-benzoquinol methylase